MVPHTSHTSSSSRTVRSHRIQSVEGEGDRVPPNPLAHRTAHQGRKKHSHTIGTPNSITRSRGQIIPRGKRRWLLRIFLGVEGKQRRYTSKTFKGTWTEARNELTRLLRDSDTGSLIQPSKETVGAFLKRWLRTKLDVAPRTVYDYGQRLKLYVLPEIGMTKLSDLTPVAVSLLYGKLSRERGISPRTVRYVHGILHHALEQAVDWGLLEKNPTHRATLPKQARRAPTILGAGEIASLLSKAINDPLCALWYVLLTTGLRPGEALALKWPDLVGSALFVRRTLVNNGKGTFSIAEAQAKTKESIRSVTIPASTLEALERHRQRQEVQMIVTGARYQNQGFIFASELGTPIDPYKVSKRWKSLLKREGLPTNIRLYDTRHSHATALLTKGVNLAWVSQRLGHSDVKMTMSVYAHVMPEAHREMADVMQEIVAAKVTAS